MKKTKKKLLNNWRKDSSQTFFLAHRSQTPMKARETIFHCFVLLFQRCVDKSRERLFNKKLVSSGDAFLTPKRGNTASAILFHFNTGDGLGRGGGREGGRDNETEQEGRWDVGLIWAIKLLQWAGGQRFIRTAADHCNTLRRPSPKRANYPQRSLTKESVWKLNWSKNVLSASLFSCFWGATSPHCRLLKMTFKHFIFWVFYREHVWCQFGCSFTFWRRFQVELIAQIT